MIRRWAILFFMGLVLCMYRLQAQDGVYLTQQDFKSHKLIVADDRSVSYVYAGTGGDKTDKLVFSFKVKGKTREYNADDIYAVVMYGHFMRFDKQCKGCYYTLSVKNDYCMWHCTTPKDQDLYLVSVDSSSEIYDVTHLEQLKALVAQHQEFAPLLAKVEASTDEKYYFKLLNSIKPVGVVKKK